MGKIWAGKVGTIPAVIQLRYNYTLEIGKTVFYREEEDCIYSKGVIEDIHYNRNNEPYWLRISKR